MNINIKATNIDLTDAIRDLVNEKVSSLDKYYDRITHVDVEVGKESNHHQKGDVYFAEVNLDVPGRLVRVRKNSNDLYKAFEKVRDHMKVELEKLKGKQDRIDRKAIRAQRETDMNEGF
jgi:putative sigma-54 modulation protein